MGGWNSGRYGGRATVEGCGSVILDVNQLVRLAPPEAGSQSTIRACMSGKLDDCPFRIEFALTLIPNEETGWCRISHPNIRHLSRDTGHQDYTVALTGTPCRFGGLRWWFICPITGRLAGKLYLPNGARRFASRHAYGLAYASQRRSAIDGSHDRLRRLYRKLGGKYEHFEQPPPRKPKWMRWRTYERLLARIAEAEDAHNAVFLAGAARLLARSRRLGLDNPFE
jgi:hypothetical protein